jgi:hypothetical protein
VLTDTKIDSLLAGGEPTDAAAEVPAARPFEGSRLGERPAPAAPQKSATRSLWREHTPLMGSGEKMKTRTVEQLKLVLGAEGWKAFMAEVAAARGPGRDVVVRRWLAVAETMRAEKLAEQMRLEAKARGRRVTE